MSLENIRKHLDPEREDEPGFTVPSLPSEWRALTDHELALLHRKITVENSLGTMPQIQNEMMTRLIEALGKLRQASDRASTRLYVLTWLLVVLTAVILAFTVVAAIKS